MEDWEFEMRKIIKFNFMKQRENWTRQLREENSNLRYVTSNIRNHVASDIRQLAFKTGRPVEALPWTI